MTRCQVRPPRVIGFFGTAFDFLFALRVLSFPLRAVPLSSTQLSSGVH